MQLGDREKGQEGGRNNEKLCRDALEEELQVRRSLSNWKKGKRQA